MGVVDQESLVDALQQLVESESDAGAGAGASDGGDIRMSASRQDGDAFDEASSSDKQKPGPDLNHNHFRKCSHLF